MPAGDLRQQLVAARIAKLGGPAIPLCCQVLIGCAAAHVGVRQEAAVIGPADGEGRRRTFEDIPTSIGRLEDDPFRSLAGELRRAGGYAKDTTPFSEFIWADFLRRRITRKLVEKDFSAAMTKALAAAKSEAANYLPGWCGPVSEN